MTTTTRERPILFSGEMVRAILADQKTQTRRVIVPQPTYHSGRHWWRQKIVNGGPELARAKMLDFCPYGKPADRLWVRETWCPLEPHHYRNPWLPRDTIIHAGTSYQQCNGAAYKANCGDGSDGDRCRQDYIAAGYAYHWRPSIHMPRWACRLRLEVVGVRVQHLHEISEEDAAAEGVKLVADRDPSIDVDCRRLFADREEFVGLREYFAILWSRINGPRGFNWHTNPWVWVIDFRRAEA